MKHTYVRVVQAMLALGTAFLVGCGPKVPPTELVKEKLGKSLPPYTSIPSVTVEPSGTTNVYNYKAEIEVSVPLFVRVQSPEPSVTLVKQVHEKGARLPIYGKFAAEKNVDKWELKSFEITDAPGDKDGDPLVSFGAAYLANSAEAEKAIQEAKVTREAAETATRERAIAAEKADRERKEAEAKRKAAETAEKARVAAEQKAKLDAAKAAYMKKHVDAVPAGKQFTALVSFRDSSFEKLQVIITKADETGFTAEVSSENDRTIQGLWSGVVRPPLKKDDGMIAIAQMVPKKKTPSKVLGSKDLKFQLEMDNNGDLVGEGFGNNAGRFQITLKSLSN